jgi:hypothetical protein
MSLNSGEVGWKSNLNFSTVMILWFRNHNPKRREISVKGLYVRQGYFFHRINNVLNVLLIALPLSTNGDEAPDVFLLLKNCLNWTWIYHQFNVQFYLFNNNITSWSSTCFEHRCAHLQEDNCISSETRYNAKQESKTKLHRGETQYLAVRKYFCVQL